MIDSIVKIVRGIIKLRGGSDNSIIGNTGDRLKVDTQITSIGGGIAPSYSSKLRYIDMNVSSGGVARGTLISSASWSTVFYYGGSGLVSNFILNLETSTKWQVRLIIDGEEIFGSNGIYTDDLIGDSIYDLDVGGKSVGDFDFGGNLIIGTHDTLRWGGPLEIPIKYNSSIEIKVKRIDGEGTKKFQAGLIILTKET